MQMTEEMQARDKRIVVLAKTGQYSLADLSKENDISRERVRQILLEHNIKLPKNKISTKTLRVIEDIKILAEEGNNIRQIAERVGKGYYTTLAIITKHTIPVKKRQSLLDKIEVGDVLFGWTVLEEPFRDRTSILAKCQCLCGRIQFVNLYNVTRNLSHHCRSCAATIRGGTFQEEDYVQLRNVALNFQDTETEKNKEGGTPK